MAEMGLVRKIDDLGRVVIPKEFRKTFNWPIGMENGEWRMEVRGKSVYLLGKNGVLQTSAIV